MTKSKRCLCVIIFAALAIMLLFFVPSCNYNYGNRESDKNEVSAFVLTPEFYEEVIDISNGDEIKLINYLRVDNIPREDGTTLHSIKDKTKLVVGNYYVMIFRGTSYTQSGEGYGFGNWHASPTFKIALTGDGIENISQEKTNIANVKTTAKGTYEAKHSKSISAVYFAIKFKVVAPCLVAATFKIDDYGDGYLDYKKEFSAVYNEHIDMSDVAFRWFGEDDVSGGGVNEGAYKDAPNLKVGKASYLAARITFTDNMYETAMQMTAEISPEDRVLATMEEANTYSSTTQTEDGEVKITAKYNYVWGEAAKVAEFIIKVQPKESGTVDIHITIKPEEGNGYDVWGIFTHFNFTYEAV